MKYFSQCVLILIIAFVLGNHQSLSINCFECGSHTDPDCGDPFNNVTMPRVDCSRLGKPVMEKPDTPTHMCRKTRTSEINGWDIKRDCCIVGETDDKDKAELYCSYRGGDLFKTREWYFCYGEDGCNGSPSHLEHSYPLAIALIFAFYGLCIY